MALKLLGNLSKVIPEVAYMLWQKSEFREMIDFEKITQTEQDRIFNELEVSFLGLFYLYLENLIEKVEEKSDLETLTEIKSTLVKGFLDIMRGAGVEEKFIEQWRELIELRIKEYREDFKLLMESSKEMKEFKNDEGLRVVWGRVETITLDCLTHIRRGKLEEKDPLRRYLQEWISGVDQLFGAEIKKLIFKPQGRT